MRVPGFPGRHRVDPVPAEVRQRAALAPREKVLASAQAEDGTWLLGTRRLLVLVPAEGGTIALPWEQVEDAGWDTDESRLRLRAVGEFGRPRPEWSLAMAEPPLFLQLLRERVTASVLLQRRVPVSGGLGLTVIARRSPVGGAVAWMHSYDPGLDPDDPVVAAVADQALAQARAELGEAADGVADDPSAAVPGPI
ncbi:hypothetical protein SAMN04488570_0472 [Nocardioides scoriae]|uniref:Uncharacterized protein n=1 Tax=Nocardioides scoriae TaxID=642780 RepID=A0A1H1M5N2_9ACTN|nr:hypothetical protein [Nocardioides scoriae]SDR81960.1 hypothetical protein SAMN04488570_0472 [Nocardioides scoriae]